jgi:hypothetical protein
LELAEPVGFACGGAVTDVAAFKLLVDEDYDEVIPLQDIMRGGGR